MQSCILQLIASEKDIVPVNRPSSAIFDKWIIVTSDSGNLYRSVQMFMKLKREFIRAS